MLARTRRESSRRPGAGRKKTGAGAVLAQHGQHADVHFVHHGEGFRHRGAGRHADDVARHHIADLGRDIGHEARRGHAESFEDEVDAVIGVAAAGGLRVRGAGAALEFRVGHRGTDRVGVRVAVADDQKFAVAHGGVGALAQP